MGTIRVSETVVSQRASAGEMTDRQAVWEQVRWERSRACPNGTVEGSTNVTGGGGGTKTSRHGRGSEGGCA